MTHKKKENIFFYLLSLTVFFIFAQLNFFLLVNKSYYSDYTFISDNLHLYSIVLPSLIFFIAVQLSLNLIYCLLIWVVTELIAKLIPIVREKKFFFAIGLFLWGIITLLAANHYYFPNSIFSSMTSIILFNSLIAKFTLLFFLSISCFALLLALISLIKNFFNYFLVSAIACSFFILITKDSTPKFSFASAAQPNVILIGVDSLRPDHLQFFGGKNSTPFFDSFLKHATVFTKAITPLARTFPSWSSILSGEYPREISIRTNLARQDNLHLENTLPAILRRHGYETIYATDEVRFSNIDKKFGFDKIIGPPMGVNDFLIGHFNDFLLSSFLINTRVGKWLFPYSYANRAVYFSYNPNSFLDLINSNLSGAEKKPLFLSAHFCLSHHAYMWADSKTKSLPAEQRYIKSVERVDKQIKDFFVLLKRNHLLDHAIVVLLSDHGEALELSGDRVTEKELFISNKNPKIIPKFYPPALDKEEVNQTAGHGSDVLSLAQYHTLLAFKLFGLNQTQAQTHDQTKMISGVVSLLDIKPTILSLLNLPITQASGISLANTIEGKAQTTPLRHLFMESDYSPQSILTVYPDKHKVIAEGIEIFEVDPVLGLLTVKKDMMRKIIESKQYADIYGEWILALYPQNKKIYMPILVNLNTGFWTNDLQSVFAKQSPAESMFKELKRFYGEELKKV